MAPAEDTQRGATPAVNARDNYLRAVRFQRPDYIPVVFAVSPACWHSYPQDWLCEQMERHPFLFPNFWAPALPYAPIYEPIADSRAPFTDDFGCVWKTAIDGLIGTVVTHPLEDLEEYVFPDPAVCMGIGPMDWQAEQRRVQALRAANRPVILGLRHGHTFLQLCDLMGYSNLLYAMSDEDPRLERVIAGVERFNMGIVERQLAMRPDVMTYAEDLGMQQGPMISPELFRQYIAPSYRRLMEPARKAGVLIHMHSDGDIRTLSDELVEGGVDILNLQDLVNGIDWIAARYKGKVCIDLDIDRQQVTPHGTPAQVDALVREAVEKLGSREGGLTMVFGLYPGTPMENVEALMTAMERYAFYYS
ncbi:hypothetical protein LJC60_06455 [Ruminococcaceae bacterium OttesenSCG-928-D13]|nr:hypothetical protein [Ruminococcaceae bacterium OttesenSCG-928-D13]